MAAVTAHEGSAEKTQFGKEPAENGYLEDNAQREGQGHEGADIGVERNHIGHVGLHLISTQETEGERKDQQITHSHPHHEEQIAEAHHPDHIVTLTGIERRRDKAEQLVEDIGRGEYHAHTHRCLDMDEKLLCQSGIDQLHAQRLLAGQTAT